MDIHPQFDPRTRTLTYLVSDPDTGDAVVFDAVLDLEVTTGRVWTESIDALLSTVAERGLTLRAAIDTHVHADHLSGAHTLRERLSIPAAIGADVCVVQRTFAPLLQRPADHPVDGRQFDVRVAHGDIVQFGSLRFEIIATPGHTPACVSWRIGDAVFTGDALFLPDGGVGRCDFPGGSAEALYDSIHGRLYQLPDDTRVFVGHDYQPGGRPLRWETTIGESKAHNIQLPADRCREAFVAARVARDATLPPPALLFPSIQVNTEAGRLPAPGPDGRRFGEPPTTWRIGRAADP